MIIFVSILSYFTLNASQLDLERVDEYKFRSHLRPVFSVMASQNELPLPMSCFNESRKILFGSSIFNIYNIYDDEDNGDYIPAFWAGFVASPNLSLFMQMAHGKWHGENIGSFGPVINFIWGKEKNEYALNIGIHHLRGPNDFRVKDVSLSLIQNTKFKETNFYYGLASHYVNSVIEVENSDKKKTINETIYHFRTGFYKKISFFDMGVELDLSNETIITKYKIVVIL